MFTWGSKYLFGVAAVSLLGAAIYGLVSGGGLLGVISLGYKGGVGDHTGYAILVAVGVVSAMLGVLTVAIRDGDADEAASLVGADHALVVATPRSQSFWGPLAAFGVACIAVGLAVSTLFVILGIVVLSVVMLEWLVLAWSDRATGDPEVNTVIKNRVLGPFEIPMLSMLGIAVVVIGLSRVLLTVSEIGSTVVASLVAAFIFFAAVLIAKSDAPRQIISGVVAVAALAVLAGGIFGAVNGERDIAHHEEPGAGDHDEGGTEGEGE